MANLGEISIDINANISKAQAKLKQLEKQLNLVVDVKLPKLNSTGSTAQYKGGSNDDCCDRLLGSINRLHKAQEGTNHRLDRISSEIRYALRSLESQNQAVKSAIVQNTEKTKPRPIRDAFINQVAFPSVGSSLKFTSNLVSPIITSLVGDISLGFKKTLNSVSSTIASFSVDLGSKDLATIWEEQTREYYNYLKKDSTRADIRSEWQAEEVRKGKRGAALTSEMEEFDKNYDAIAKTKALEYGNQLIATIQQLRGNQFDEDRQLSLYGSLTRLPTVNTNPSINRAIEGLDKLVPVIIKSVNQRTEPLSLSKSTAEKLLKKLTEFNALPDSAKTPEKIAEVQADIYQAQQQGVNTNDLEGFIQTTEESINQINRLAQSFINAGTEFAKQEHYFKPAEILSELRGTKVTPDEAPRILLNEISGSSEDAIFLNFRNEITLSKATWEKYIKDLKRFVGDTRRVLTHEVIHSEDLGSGFRSAVKAENSETSLTTPVPSQYDPYNKQYLQAFANRYPGNRQEFEVRTEAHARKIALETRASFQEKQASKNILAANKDVLAPIILKLKQDLEELDKSLQGKEPSEEIERILSSFASIVLKSEEKLEKSSEILSKIDDPTQDVKVGELRLAENSVSKLPSTINELVNSLPALEAKIAALGSRIEIPLNTDIYQELEKIPVSFDEIINSGAELKKSFDSLSESVDSHIARKVEIREEVGAFPPQATPSRQNAVPDYSYETLSKNFRKLEKQSATKTKEFKKILADLDKSNQDPTERAAKLEQAKSLLETLKAFRQKAEKDFNEAKKVNQELTGTQRKALGGIRGRIGANTNRFEQQLEKYSASSLVIANKPNSDNAIATVTNTVVTSLGKVGKAAETIEGAFLAPIGGKAAKRITQAGIVAGVAATSPVGAGLVEVHQVLSAFSSFLTDGLANNLTEVITSAISNGVAHSAGEFVAPLANLLSKIPGASGVMAQTSHAAGIALHNTVSTASHATLSGGTELGMVGAAAGVAKQQLNKIGVKINAQHLKGLATDLRTVTNSLQNSSDLNQVLEVGLVKVAQARSALQTYISKGGESQKQIDNLTAQVEVLEGVLGKAVAAQGLKNARNISQENPRGIVEAKSEARIPTKEELKAYATQTLKSKKTYQDLAVSLSGFMVSQLVTQLGGSQVDSIAADVITATLARSLNGVIQNYKPGDNLHAALEEMVGGLVGNIGDILLSSVPGLAGVPLKGAALAMAVTPQVSPHLPGKVKEASTQSLIEPKSEAFKENLENLIRDILNPEVLYHQLLGELNSSLAASGKKQWNKPTLTDKSPTVAGIKTELNNSNASQTLNTTAANIRRQAVDRFLKATKADLDASVQNYYKSVQQPIAGIRNPLARTKIYNLKDVIDRDAFDAVDIFLKQSIIYPIKTQLSRLKNPTKLNPSTESLDFLKSPTKYLKNLGYNPIFRSINTKDKSQEDLTKIAETLYTMQSVLVAKLEDVANESTRKLIQKKIKQLSNAYSSAIKPTQIADLKGKSPFAMGRLAGSSLDKLEFLSKQIVEEIAFTLDEYNQETDLKVKEAIQVRLNELKTLQEQIGNEFDRVSKPRTSSRREKNLRELIRLKAQKEAVDNELDTQIKLGDKGDATIITAFRIKSQQLTKEIAKKASNEKVLSIFDLGDADSFFGKFFKSKSTQAGFSAVGALASSLFQTNLSPQLSLLASQLGHLKERFEEIFPEFSTFIDALTGSILPVTTLAATVALPVIAIAKFGKQAIETARQFSLLETTINSFGGGSTLASNLSAASKELINLKSLAQGLPQYLSTTFGGMLEGDTDTYISLQKSLANRGIGGQQAERANTALLQMLSKGKVSMEELRQQLSEALPGTMQMAARAYNQSVGEFVKAVSKGTIGGDDFYNRFVRQLAKESTGFGDNQASQLTKLENAWDNLGTKAELALGKILLGFASFNTGGLVETLESAGKAIDYVAERAGIFIGSLLALSAIQLARPIWLAVEAITFANATGFKLAGSLGLAQKAAAGFGAVMKQAFIIGGVLALADVIQGVFTSGILDSVKAIQSLKKELNSLPQDTAKQLSSGSGVLDFVSGITRALSGGNVKEFNKARRAYGEKEISAEEFEQMVNPVGAMKRIENNDAYTQKLGSLSAEIIGVENAVNKITLADKKVQDFIARVKQLEQTKASLQVQIIAGNITPEQRDAFKVQMEQLQSQMDALKLDVIPNGDPAQIEAQIDAIKRAFDDSVQKGFKTEADRPAMEALVSRMRSTATKVKAFWKELENTTNISTALKALGNNFDAVRTKIDTEDSQRKTSVTNLILSRKIKPEEEGLYQQNNAVEQARDKWKSFNEQLQLTQELINTVSTADLSVLESVIGKSYKDFNSADIEKLKSQGEVTPFTPTQQAAIEAIEKQIAVTKELEGATNSYGDALVARQKANDEFIRQLHTIADIMAIVKGYADGIRFENTFKVASNAVNSSAYLAKNPQLSDNEVQQTQLRDRLNEALNNKNSSDYSVKIKVANLKALRYGVQEELNKLKIGDVSKMDMPQLNKLEAELIKINKVQPVSGDLMAYVAGYKEIRENQLQVLQDSKAINDVVGEINKWKFENWTSFGITVAELNTKFAALASIAKELNEVTDRAFNQNALSNLQSSTGSRTGDTFRSQQAELERLEDYTKNAQSGLNQLKEAFSNWKQPDELSFEGDKFTMPIQAIQNLLDSAANGTFKLSGESKAYLETLKNIRQQSDDLTAAQTRLWTEIADRQIPAATRALIDYQSTISALEFKLKALSSGSKIGILRNAIANQSTDKEYQRADRGNTIQLLNEELSLRQRILKAKEAAALVGLNKEEKVQIRELLGGNPLKATRQDLEEALGILNAAPKVYSEGVKQSVESLRQLSDEKLDFKRAQENQLSAVFDIIKSQQDLVKSIKNAAKSLRDAVKDLQEKQAKLASFSLYNFNDKNPETRFNVPTGIKFSDLDSQIQSEIKSKEEAGKAFINSIKSLGKEYESLVKDLDKNIKDIRKETEKALKEITSYQLEAAGIRKYGNQGFAADMFKQFNDVFKAFNEIGNIEEVDSEKFKNQLEGYQERISQATEKEAEAREELANKIIEANQKIAQRFEELAKEQEKAAEEVRAAQEKVAEASQELASLTNEYNANNSLLNRVGVEFRGAAQEQISAANALKQAAAALGAAAGKPINLGDLASFRSTQAAQYQQSQYQQSRYQQPQYQQPQYDPATLTALRTQLNKDIEDYKKRVNDRDRERASIEKDKKYTVPALAAYSQPINWEELAPRYSKMLETSRQLAKEYQQLQARRNQLYGNITQSTPSAVQTVNRTGMYPNGTIDIRNMRYENASQQYNQDPRQSDLYQSRTAEARSMIAPWETKAKARINAFKREAERNLKVNVELNTAKADVKLAELEAKINEIYIDLPRQLADKQRQAQDAVFSYREYQNQYLPNRNDSINLAGDKIESEIKRKAEDMRLQAQELRAKDSKTLDIDDFTDKLNRLKASGTVGQNVIQTLENKLRQAASGSISLSQANEELINTLESNADSLDKIAPTAGAIERIKLAHQYSQNLAKVQQDISSQLMEAQFQSLGSGLSPYYEKRLRAEMELANFASKAADRRQSTIDTMRENKASNDEIERTISLLDKLDAIEFSNLQRNTKVLQKEILDGLGGALEQTLSSFFKAETSLGEAFANLGRSILQMFADIAAKAVTAKLMGWVGGLFGMGGGGIPLFKDGGEVGVKRFAMGGSVPRFDNGGSIQDALALGLGIRRSLALEGNGAVPVVAHKGEQILTDLNGDAQLFRALQKSGEWTQIKSDRVNRYATGGTVGYAGSDLGRVSNSRDKFVRNNNVNTQITVVAKDANSFVKAKSHIQRDMQAEQQRAAQRLS